jgi:hypothetical protein
MKLAAKTSQETHFLSIEETEKWIDDYVEREAAVVRKPVQDPETAIMQEQEHMGNVEQGRLTTTTTEITCEEMLNTIGDSLSVLASPEDQHDGEDVDDDEEDTGLRKLSDDGEPGWVMGIISKTVQNRNVSFRQNPMTQHKLTQTG